MTIQQKPILHGRDHAVNGPDPIPGAGGGIQFDTDNEGGWLFVQTNDTSEAGGSLFGYGIDLRDEGTGGIRLKSFAGVLLEAATAAKLWSHTGKVTIQSDQTTAYPTDGILVRTDVGSLSMIGEGIGLGNTAASGFLTMNPTGSVQLAGVDLALSCTSLGFYGATPVVQAAHPTTLADVITALTDLGLTA